jgi:biopolymer transport protein TolR
MAHFKVQAAPVMAAPNVIPMADIMLVLLIIFMVVTPMLQKGMSVEMAKVTNPVDMPNADRDDAIIVGISRDGVIFLGNQKTALDQVSSLVRDRISNRPDKTVFIKSDGRAKYGDVVKLVDEVRSAGVDNVGLLTEKSEQGRTPPPPSLRPAGN